MTLPVRDEAYGTGYGWDGMSPYPPTRPRKGYFLPGGAVTESAPLEAVQSWKDSLTQGSPSTLSLRNKSTTVTFSTQAGTAVTIDLATGNVVLAEHMTPDEGAKAFWNAVRRLAPQPQRNQFVLVGMAFSVGAFLAFAIVYFTGA